MKVGGLGDFSAGFVRALWERDIEVTVVLPDYGFAPFRAEDEWSLRVPDWVGPAVARRGHIDGAPVTLIATPGIAKPNPYVDVTGEGWPDNDQRFLGFSAAVAALVEQTMPDVLHINDWHTAGVFGFVEQPPPSVLTIHNLAYQGETSGEWFTVNAGSYRHNGQVNPLAGGIALADQVVTVSPTFARESLPPAHGFGLAELLASRGEAFTGILNGIDTEVWDPATDPHLGSHYDCGTFEDKQVVRRALLDELGWEDYGTPLVGMVTRLTDQKGVDLALPLVPELRDLGARMVLLGSGDKVLADNARTAAAEHPDHFVFRDGYDEGLSHRIFGGSDLYLMPSRFEPAGLTQMQAMRYGSIPVVTDVGGLHDTVTEGETGFVVSEVTVAAIRGALERAVAAWRTPERRTEIALRGMRHDWSWNTAAEAYIDLYEAIT